MAQVVDGDMIENLILRAVQMIAFGVDVREIHDSLVRSGCDEGQAYLIFKAATVLVRE